MSVTPLLPYAIQYAAFSWPVFPLRGKVPAIANPHPEGSEERQQCRGEGGLDGHGVLDATTDLATVARWWTKRPYANIGGRIPANMIMIDVDPRSGGLESLSALIAEHGPLPATLTDLSGRFDGGLHFWFRRPPGMLTGTRLGPGIDLKTETGYAVLPPSVHPVTGRPFVRIERPVSVPPCWLIDLLAPTVVTGDPSWGSTRSVWSRSIADRSLWAARSPTITVRRRRGTTSSSRTGGGVATATVMPTGHGGCIRVRRVRAVRPSDTSACSSGRRTPRSRSPNRQTRTVTRSSGRSRCSTTTAT